MGNVGCDFCIRSRKENQIADLESIDRNDPLKTKIEKFIKVHSKYIISKSKERLIYYNFITSSKYILFSHSFYLILTSESIYVIDEYMMNILKRIPLQYITSLFQCSSSGNIGIVHYSQVFKTPLMLLNVKESKEILEIPKSYTDEILERLKFFAENASSLSLSIKSTSNFKAEGSEILEGNKKSYELYTQIKKEFRAKIKAKLMIEKPKILRIYYLESALQVPSKEENEELTFLVLMNEELIFFEGREAFLDITERIFIKDITNITCNELCNRFIIRTEAIVRELKSLFSSEIILAAKTLYPNPNLPIRILSTREYLEYQKGNYSKATSSNISHTLFPEGSNREAQQTDLKVGFQEKLLTTYESEGKAIQNREGKNLNTQNSYFTHEKNVDKKILHFNLFQNENFSDYTIKLNYNVNFESPLPTPFSIEHEDSIIDGEDIATENLLKLASVRLWKLYKNYNN